MATNLNPNANLTATEKMAATTKNAAAGLTNKVLGSNAMQNLATSTTGSNLTGSNLT